MVGKFFRDNRAKEARKSYGKDGGAVLGHSTCGSATVFVAGFGAVLLGNKIGGIQ